MLLCSQSIAPLLVEWPKQTSPVTFWPLHPSHGTSQWMFQNTQVSLRIFTQELWPSPKMMSKLLQLTETGRFIKIKAFSLEKISKDSLLEEEPWPVSLPVSSPSSVPTPLLHSSRWPFLIPCCPPPPACRETPAVPCCTRRQASQNSGKSHLLEVTLWKISSQNQWITPLTIIITFIIFLDRFTWTFKGKKHSLFQCLQQTLPTSCCKDKFHWNKYCLQLS